MRIRRLDEACVGDLVTLEAKGEGITGIVIWGLHRDSQELREIGLPLFSLANQGHGDRSKLPKSSAVQRIHVAAGPGRQL